MPSRCSKHLNGRGTARNLRAKKLPYYILIISNQKSFVKTLTDKFKKIVSCCFPYLRIQGIFIPFCRKYAFKAGKDLL